MKSLYLSVAVLALSAGAAFAKGDDLDKRAHEIHDRVIALDTHVDIVDHGYATAALDPGGFTKGQVDLPKMRAGGLDAIFLIVYTPQGPLTADGFAEARHFATAKLNAITRMTRAYPRDIALALSASDARSIDRSGRKVAFIGMENPYPLGATVEDVKTWRDAGVRYMGVTHFGHNQFGDSSNPNTEGGDPDEKYGGLSSLGRELVAELNRVGIMIDVSHASRKTMMQVIELSKAPIIASHSSIAALADAPRNLDDEQLRALAANGGVVQITAVDVYLKPFTQEQKDLQAQIKKEMKLESDEAMETASDEVKAEYQKRMQAVWAISPRANVGNLVDHIDYAVKVAGIDHVGISSDFDGGGGIDGWDDASETYNVTRELVRRGYSEEDIGKIWSGNLLRVLSEVQKKAEK